MFFRVTLKDRTLHNKAREIGTENCRESEAVVGSGELGNFVVSEFDKSVEMPTLA